MKSEKIEKIEGEKLVFRFNFFFSFENLFLLLVKQKLKKKKKLELKKENMGYTQTRIIKENLSKTKEGNSLIHSK